MRKTKGVGVVEEQKQEFEPYIQDEKEREVCSAVFQKFRHTADARNQNFENLDGLNIVDYIEDSVHRFTTNVSEREGIDDWQARMHDPFTANKVKAVHAKVVQEIPIAKAMPRGEEDSRRAHIISDLYDYSEDIDDYDDLMSSVALESLVKGTAVAYEGHEKKITLKRDVTGTGDDIKVKEVQIHTNRLYGKLVRLEDFYPSSVGISSIKRMPFCFWREVMPYAEFMQNYSMYKQSEKVLPQNKSQVGVDGHPSYLDYISNDVDDGNVEVIKYYNKESDEFVMIANNVWLNPIESSGGWEISPLPFNHKELPFWEVRNEMLDPNFFYGKSMPDKLKAMQDILDALTNMLLDQSFLTVFKPILTNGFDSIEDDFMRPGRRTPVDTQGLSIKEAVMEMDISAPSGWHQYIMDYMRKIMEEASIDKTSQGIAGVGERTTAQEIRLAAEGSAAVIGVLGMSFKNGAKRKGMLRMKNIMQFYSDPGSPLVEMIGGEGATKKFNKAFNTFVIGDSVMTDGTRGSKIIEMYKDKEDMPDKPDIKARADVYELENDKKIEIVAINSNYIRNADIDIKVVANPLNENTRDMDKAIQLEKVKVYKSFFPNIIDDTELAAQTMEAMGDDPTLLIREDILNPQPVDESAQKGQMESPMSTNPSTNTTDNMMRGAMGGDIANNMQM